MASFWDWYYENGIIPNLWKGFTGQKSADRNNDQNLAFQREQFEYQKELNQTQMEREDTAFQRAASDASKVGINPMSLASGNGASSSPLSSTSFSGSSSQGVSGVGLLSTLLSSVNDAKNSKAQRDLLRSQKEKQDLDNAINAYDYGFSKDKNGSWIPSSISARNKRFWDDINERLKTIEARNNAATASRNERVNQYQQDNNINDSTSKDIQTIIDLMNQLQNQGDKKNKKSLIAKIKQVYQDYIADNPRRPNPSTATKEDWIRFNQKKYYADKIKSYRKQANKN